MVNIHGSVAKVVDLRTAGSTHREDYVKRLPKPNPKFDAAFTTDAVVKRGTPAKHPSSKHKTPSPSAILIKKRQLYANSSDDDEDKVYFKSGMFSIIIFVLASHNIFNMFLAGSQSSEDKQPSSTGSSGGSEEEEDERGSSDNDIDEVAALMALKQPKPAGKRPIAKAPPDTSLRGGSKKRGRSPSPTPTGKRSGRKPAPRHAPSPSLKKKAHPLSKEYRTRSDSEDSVPKKKDGRAPAPKRSASKK